MRYFTTFLIITLLLIPSISKSGENDFSNDSNCTAEWEFEIGSDFDGAGDFTMGIIHAVMITSDMEIFFSSNGGIPYFSLQLDYPSIDSIFNFGTKGYGWTSPAGNWYFIPKVEWEELGILDRWSLIHLGYRSVSIWMNANEKGGKL